MSGRALIVHPGATLANVERDLLDDAAAGFAAASKSAAIRRAYAFD